MKSADYASLIRPTGLEKSGDGLLLRLLMADGIRIDDCDEKDVRLKPGADDRALADAVCQGLEKESFGGRGHCDSTRRVG